MERYGYFPQQQVAVQPFGKPFAALLAFVFPKLRADKQRNISEENVRVNSEV